LRIREQEGLAYSIHSGIGNFEDVGSFQVQAGLDKTRIEPAIKLIKEELNKFQEISEEELQRAKDHIVGKMAIDLEDTAAVSIWYGVQELMMGKILEPKEKTEKIMAVTLSDLMSVAKEVIDFRKSNLAIIGPFKGEEKFRKLLEN
jgi:predicted Zn-dependent peptidase